MIDGGGGFGGNGDACGGDTLEKGTHGLREKDRREGFAFKLGKTTASHARRRLVLRSSQSEGGSGKPAMSLAGCDGCGMCGGVFPLPDKSLVQMSGGFRFTSPPATFWPSLPGLKRFAQFDSVGILVVVHNGSQ